jgi:DNA repair exonuclease SbcCD ATPase subunit
VLKDDLKNKLIEKVSKFDEEIAEITAEIGGLKHETKAGKKVIKELNNNDICPACNTVITPEHKEKELKRFTTIIDTNKVQIKSLEADIKHKQEQKDVLTKNIETINTALHQIKTSTKLIEGIRKNIEDVKKNIEKKEAEELNLDLKSIEDNLKKNKTQLDELNNELQEYTEKESIMEVASFLLSDSGIKTEFYHSIVPLFNKTINAYITKFELPITITFDYEFNVTIRSVTSGNDDLNYFSFSEGEKKRIEISILLSFIKLSKTVANWSTNILGLDETLDSGIDGEGLQIMLDSIKDIASEEQLNVMIITHKVITSDIFDRKILVTKDSFFSKLLDI